MAAASTASSSPPPPTSLFFDDDDDFGDFEFAPPPPPDPTANLSHQQPPPRVATKRSSGVAVDEDDEWGDFVESNGSCADLPPEPAVNQAKKVWEKPTGPLPLSIFGEEEDEDEEVDVGNSTLNGAKDSISSSSKVTPGVSNGAVPGSGGGEIRDLIADLYGRDHEDGDAGKGHEGEDYDESGWEFKDAGSSQSSGEGAGIQVLGNGLEHGQGRSMFSGAYNHMWENGVASFLPEHFPSSVHQNGPTSTVKCEIDELNYENGLNPDSTSRDVGTVAPAEDIVLHSSSPGKDDAGSNSHCRFEDWDTDLHSLDNKLGSHKYGNGSFSNGVIDKCDGTISNDDDDFDANWEFKDAMMDTRTKHEVQVEVTVEGVENIDLVAYHGTEDKTEYATNPNLTASNASPTTDVPFSSTLHQRSSLLDAESKNIRNMLDDLYSQSDKFGVDNTATHNNSCNNDLGASLFTNDDWDDSNWEFKHAIPNMCSEESNSLHEQNNFMESSISASIRRNKEPHSILNDLTGFPTINERNDPSAFEDLLFDGGNQSTLVDFVQEPTHSAIGVSGNINYVNSDDNFPVSNQDIKIALPENGTKDKSMGRTEIITKLESEAPVDFYTELKDVSHFLVLQHLDDLKEAHDVAKFSGEEDKAISLHKKIQEAYVNLHNEVGSSENISMECLSKDICIESFLERLQKPYLQAFETEYLLSEKISLAKKNLSSAIHLFKLASLTLRLFNAASYEDQRIYIITWSKMISACVQELQHGATIWAQCLQANAQKQILSEIQGSRYFVALGEFFRATTILSVTFTMYKPWLLLNPVDSEELLIKVRECSMFWTSPGLEKALENILDLADFKKKEKIKALLDSINLIHGLCRSDLLSDIPRHEDSVCQLSLLPLETLQDMETVVWSGKNYFLKLANLWANRVSSDSPSLPFINFGR